MFASTNGSLFTLFASSGESSILDSSDIERDGVGEDDSFFIDTSYSGQIFLAGGGVI